MRNLDGASLTLITVIAALHTATPASADPATFVLDTGNLNSGSGVAFDGNAIIGLYLDGTTIPVEVTFDGPLIATLDFDLSIAGIPDAREIFSDTRFAFTLQGDNHVVLTLDLVTGEINGDLADPTVPVFVQKFEPGGQVPVASTTVPMSFSTMLQDPPDVCSGPPRGGLPLDPETDEVFVRGVACVSELGAGAAMVLDVIWQGTLPIPAPEASLAANATAAVFAVVALAAHRRAKGGRA